jgi:hypothetical protein
LQDSQHKILVNNAEFWVGSNLWDFLCVAKGKYKLTTFWIDAICIDQSSITERNHQVSLMGDIYSKAMWVVAWLGCNEDMVNFVRVWGYHWAIWDNLLSNRRGDHHLSAERARQAISSEEWLCGYQLINNEYWSRAWM